MEKNVFSKHRHSFNIQRMYLVVLIPLYLMTQQYTVSHSTFAALRASILSYTIYSDSLQCCSLISGLAWTWHVVPALTTISNATYVWIFKTKDRCERPVTAATTARYKTLIQMCGWQSNIHSEEINFDLNFYTAPYFASILQEDSKHLNKMQSVAT